ncbi:MAG: hypothetical protein J1E64_06210 [Acetatifactor sp.]|nr:hypothetical protein [Acetatifactor sp.]
MGVLEIVLLIAGAIIFIVSFILPVNREEISQETRELAQNEIKMLVLQEINGVRGRVDDVVDEAVDGAMETTERSLEKLSNEKIMAVSDYSDTVLKEIHKNHEEVMFLYDMLNNKHTSLKNAVTQINETVSQVNETVKNVKESRRDAEAAVSSWKQIQLESMDKQQKDAGIMRITRMKEAAEAQLLAAQQEAQRLAAQQEALERVRQVEVQKEAEEREYQEYHEQPEQPVKAEKPRSRKPAFKIPVKKDEITPKADAEETDEMAEARKALEFAVNSIVNPEETVQEPEVQEEMLNSNERILARYKQGKSTVAIAKELGLGVGEVKLVIDLYRNHA